MRIEHVKNVSQIYAGNSALKTAEKSKKSTTDQLQISQAGRDYQIAKQAVLQAEDIREDKVAEVKSRLDNGTYSVSPDDFAAKVIEKYNQLTL